MNVRSVFVEIVKTAASNMVCEYGFKGVKCREETIREKLPVPYTLAPLHQHESDWMKHFTYAGVDRRLVFA